MSKDFYGHWSHMPESLWRWPSFSREEIACRGTGKLLVDSRALDMLQGMRDRIGKPFIVRSAYRSPEHNKAVGGARRSKHLKGEAFDIAMSNHDPHDFEAMARGVGFQGFGFYPRSDFIHIDLGPARQWGVRFQHRPNRFSVESPKARDKLSESRTMRGGSVAGAGVTGAGVIEIVQDAVGDAQGTLEPLIAYSDIFKWIFLGAALIGIGVTIYARWDDWRKKRR